MNKYNENRLIQLLDDINHVEEEIVPCWAEENAFLERECDNEKFTKEMLKAKERLDVLEAALFSVKELRAHIRIAVLGNK